MKSEARLIVPPAALAVPRVEHFGGVWALEPQEASRLLALVRSTDLAAHIAARAQQGAAAPAADYSIGLDGVAVIEVRGVLTKYGFSLSSCPGSTTLRRTVRAAARDDRASSIALVIDSPGGQVAGTADLADEIASAADAKPVGIYIEDAGCSGAYWLACAGAVIWANSTALVGSIGVYSVVEDWSEAAAEQGLRVHVVRSGPFKGIGEHGAPVTDEELAEVQRGVNDLNAVFMGFVAEHRGLSDQEIGEIATGGVWVAAQALDLGLIDAIGTFEGLCEHLREMAAGPVAPASPATRETPASATLKKEQPMPISPKRPKVAAAADPTQAKEKPKAADEEEEQEAMPAEAMPAEAMPAEDEDKEEAKKPAAKRQAAPVAASPAQLKAAFPNATAEWREECAVKGLTLAQAKDAYIAFADQQMAAMKSKHADRTAVQVGADPVGLRASQGGQPAAGEAGRSAFEAAVRERMETYKEPRHIAHRKVCQTRPDLREAMVHEHNRTHAAA